MLSVQVNITGGDEIKDKLDKLGQSLYMFEAAMDSIGQSLVTYYSTLPFNSQGGVYDNVWPALSEAYALWKAKHLGTPILVADDTPHMQDSFTYQADQTSVTVGNSADYFEYLQLGTNRMPQRQMIGVNDDVRGLINDIINSDIQAKIAAA
jgi:phage gpG-like protein